MTSVYEARQATGDEPEPSPEPFVLAAPDVSAPRNEYLDLLEDGRSHDFGDFLTRPFDPSAPASGNPRAAQAFTVVSTSISTQPADPNGGPPTVNGEPCFEPG